VSDGRFRGVVADPSRRRRAAIGLLQWSLALGGFWYVGRQVAWRETLVRLADLSPLVVGAVLVVTAVEFATRFSMWYVLLNGRTPTSFATTARVDLVIKFVNHVVPSKASGHSVAPLVIRHYTGADWTEAVTTAGLNTGLYATLYGGVSVVGVGLFLRRLPRGLAVVLLLSTGLYLVAGVLVMLAGRRLHLASGLFDRLESLLGRVPAVGGRLATLAGKLPSFTDESADVFRDLSSRPVVLGVYALGWAGTLMIVPGIRVWVLLTALGGSFTPAVLLPVVLVMAYSVTVLPLTPGGVGVAEASATLVLVSLGVGADLAAAVVLVDRAFGVYLPALLGWVPVAGLDLADLLAGDG